jgi:type I restriction enzyme R subunit
MAVTDINGEDRLVQRTFAEHLEKVLGWESVYAYNAETFGPQSTLGRGVHQPADGLRDEMKAGDFLAALQTLR